MRVNKATACCFGQSHEHHEGRRLQQRHPHGRSSLGPVGLGDSSAGREVVIDLTALANFFA